MKRAILAALAAVLILAGAAPASNPSPFHFDPSMRWLQTCNDYQSTATSCVTDPQQCAWGDEDDIADVAYGKLSAGQTVTDTLCLVTDMCNDVACPHQVLFQVNDSSAAVAVTLTSDRGGSWAAAPVRIGKGYVWQACFNDPLYPASPDYPPIPGTNGGVGYVTNYTLHITAAKTTQLSAGFEIAQSNATGIYGYWHQLSGVPCP